MTEPRMIEQRNMSTAQRRVQRRIKRACEGVLLSDVATALLSEYSEVLLTGCESYEQHKRNANLGLQVLDANAREYFKVNN